jgi:hypothetical protein
MSISLDSFKEEVHASFINGSGNSQVSDSLQRSVNISGYKYITSYQKGGKDIII